jgi:hypothetical protein
MRAKKHKQFAQESMQKRESSSNPEYHQPLNGNNAKLNKNATRSPQCYFNYGESSLPIRNITMKTYFVQEHSNSDTR